MEVAPSEIPPVPANAPSNVVQSADSTGVSAPELKLGEVALSADAVGRQSPHEAFCSTPSSRVVSVWVSPKLETPKLQHMQSELCHASTKVKKLTVPRLIPMEEQELGYDLALGLMCQGEVPGDPEVVLELVVQALK